MTQTLQRHFFKILFVFLFFLGFACNGPGTTSGGGAAGSAARAAPPKVQKRAPAKIVFVSKEKACACTQKAIEAGWAALHKALGTPAKVPVDKLFIDTQEYLVQPYQQKRAIMALPALYFLDAQGEVLEQLQGEVTEAQIAQVLSAGRPM